VVVIRFLIVAAGILQATISAEAKLVWSAIYFLARTTGICDAIYHEIGDMVGLDKRAVMRAIPELIEAGLISGAGGGNGAARKFTLPPELNRDVGSHNFETSSVPEPVRNQNRSRNETGPLPKSDRTTTETVPLYKEEINNKNKSAPCDPEAAQSLQKLQQKWFEEEFWPIFWRTQDRAEALRAFALHATHPVKKDRIIKALKADLEEMLARPLQFRPYAVNWLNKRRYEDDPVSANGAGESSNRTYQEWKPTVDGAAD